ncbi:right-handed parallel beta-helix repeat-containing protein [Corallococcus sp. M34]|uniref:right-handed parallel beta-helix repeat-containing protein n=1 Tax=Citreicoccus inhibens TaxID=2849499 RepID=UPI0013156F97|nr:right-handed parallel beta-helix repeat-containing protein [Citreicoccus inhibens]MBU8894848.1 right-handed parallel beta-helix repeat-containing protein [Citreicoccus inhibens]
MKLGKTILALLVEACALPLTGCLGPEDAATVDPPAETCVGEECPSRGKTETGVLLPQGYADECGFVPCPVVIAGSVLKLAADCTTDTGIAVPNGFTLDGAGYTVTAVDPPQDHFRGAIVRNCGKAAYLRNLRIAAEGLKDICDAGEDALRGILLDGASGSVFDSEVSGINQGGGHSGCQEGTAIEVRNHGHNAQLRQVDVRGNIVSTYQKCGIRADGAVKVNVSDNVLAGVGPTHDIAQIGIEFSGGATGTIIANDIAGHSYTGATVASGILVVGGELYEQPLTHKLTIQHNRLEDNDVGINLAQAEAEGDPPSRRTDIEVTNNVLRSAGVTNGFVYQSAIADLGTHNHIHHNLISGPGYDPATRPGATFAVDVTAGAPARVDFVTTEQTVPVGACSSEVLVQSQDANRNLVVPRETRFTLTATGAASPGFHFYADPTCSGPTLSHVELSNPQAEATFYFRAVRPGMVTLKVSNAELHQSQTQHIQ